MDKTTILDVFYDSWPGEAARSLSWIFYTSEAVHFVGLCTLLGALLFVDLRLAGLWRSISLAHALFYARVALAGFLLIAISGLVMFCADPFNYWSNPVFQIKMLAILLAGCNLAWFELVERRKILGTAPSSEPALMTRCVAIASLTIWLSVIVLGRLLPSYEGAGGFL